MMHYGMEEGYLYPLSRGNDVKSPVECCPSSHGHEHEQFKHNLQEGCCCLV
ncbi:50aa long hypothetical protein [Pyrococcus horikoshii OT3]|uniref:Uncharacterized protein n=1 Tax=Pyrococcus horikoshii (strain ATCC 700860 / DSM 12428 / JCM 9974 / NBRC 100139 / OT-3) TaxID=70601 RepID=O74090_PYRHO|nr:50aa long hypothetical protein [Pyrococcus horikoshii OT3]